MTLKEVTKYNMKLLKESKLGVFALILWVFTIMLYAVMNVFVWGVSNSANREKAFEIDFNNKVYGRYKDNIEEE